MKNEKKRTHTDNEINVEHTVCVRYKMYAFYLQCKCKFNWN